MSRLASWSALVCLTVCGCGSGQYPISGTVQHGGKPVPCGEIVLTPDPDKGNSGPGLVLQIENGSFQSAGPRGQVGGAYIARISGYRAPDPGPAMSRYGFPIFIDYVEKVELPVGQAAQHDFVVPPQPPVRVGVPIGGKK
jgi:hypothetical protein